MESQPQNPEFRNNPENLSPMLMWQVPSSHGPRCEKTCHQRFANNTGTDQPVHPNSLVSAFVIRFLESNIRNLAWGEISIFLLVSVVEETGLKLAFFWNPEDSFSHDEAHICYPYHVTSTNT